MRLLKVEVNAFQCIESAEVELGPGLNILYGPNDHGKSTLAAAIRAGLLLQHSSTAVEKHVSWHTGEPPHVVLSFATESQRFWRVRKVFGKHGSSTLEASKDGLSFSKDTDARQVDDRLRELLGWGIPKPGGIGGGKGLPESFLTTVLLAEQADVPAILARSLEGDKEESGRNRLSQALQALAQEPQFKKVLDRAKAKTARAYTGGGKLSKGKDSPLQEISSQIAELRAQQDELQRKIDESETAEMVLANLHQELVDLGIEVGQMQEQVDQTSEALKLAQHRSQLELQLQAACQQVDAFQKETEEIEMQVSALRALEERLQALEGQRGEFQASEEGATQSLQMARQQLQEATSQHGAQERELRRQQLENERLQAQQRLSELQKTLSDAQQLLGLLDEAHQSARALIQLQASVGELEQTIQALEVQREQAASREKQLKQLRNFSLLEEARRQLKETRAAALQAQQSAAKAVELRAAAQEIETAVEALGLPGTEQLAAFEQLARDLDNAEARLGGGITLTLNPRQPLDLELSVDGATTLLQKAGERLELEAQRSIQLLVNDLFEATITAGEAEARKKVEQLRQDWALTGITDIKALSLSRRQADSRLREAEQQRQQAALSDQIAQEQQGRAQRLQELEERARQRSLDLATADEEMLASELARLGNNWESELNRQLQSAESQLQKHSEALQQKQQQLTGQIGRLDSERAIDERLQQRAGNAEATGVKDILDQVPAQIAALESSLADKSAELTGLTDQADLQVEQARAAVEEASQRLEQAKVRRAHLEQERGEVAQEKARSAGVLEQRQKQAQSQPVEAARARLSELEAQLNQMPLVDGTPIDLERARNRLQECQQNYQEKEKEINVAQGRLSKVGGDVVREQKEDLDLALHQAIDTERQITVEYGAWKLLADTLREVENTHGAHLGKALSGPISTRLANLCSGRYGTLDIDPHLKSGGVNAAGRVRPFDALSEGTKDQVATLFRLGIAEQLGSAILLDDHLNQSDPGKVQWFLEHLRDTGERIQVIVVTCRPDDYLTPEERAEPGQIFREGANGRMRSVDLSQAIRRYPLSSVEALVE